MELDTLILADAVSTPPDGKFYIHGGGISRYTVPQLPFPIPLGVFARLKVADADLDKTHKFLIQLIGPAGIPNIPPIEIEAAAPPEEVELVEGEERFFSIGLQIPAVAARDGLYHLEFHIAGRLVRSVPLPVVIGVDDQAVSATPAAPAKTPKSSKAVKPKTKRPPPPPKRKRPRR